MKVAVLMSTYNGEIYLAEQIESLLAQEYKDFTIYIRDDGSSDGSIRIIDEYCIQSRRVVRVESADNIGCAASFLSLLQFVDADIYLFCDQDDIWLPNKIQRVVDFYSVTEMTIPTLYHCDLAVVDQDLKLIHRSFLQHQKMSARESMKKNNLFIQNFVVGCTSAINASLAKIILMDIEEHHFKMIAMHDWWFAITARLFGNIYYDNVQTILYRQHTNNVLGAKSSSIFRFLTLGLNGEGLKRVYSFRKKVTDQSKLILQIYGASINNEQKNLIQLVINALGGNASVINLLDCMRHGCYMQGFKRNIALMYSILFSKKIQ